LLEVVVIDDGSIDGTAEAVLEMLKGGNAEPVLAGAGREDCHRQPGGQDERERTSQKLKPGRPVADSELLIADCAGGAKALDSSSPLALDAGRSTLDPQSAAKPQLRLIRHKVSAGYIVRRNEGARVAKGDVVFSLDDDAVFSSPFVLEQTLRDFSHPRIGAVAIPYIEPHKANKEMQRAPTREDVWITASYIGTAHAVRRDVFLALRGYREHLVHQGEEGDFCLRMLAADAAQVMTDSGGRETERDLFNHGGHREHGGLVCSEAGLRPDSRAVASESDSLASGLADLPISESLTRSASIPASSSPATSHSPLATPLKSAVPGFFVRLGNSDPIIHNESPKRDYSRMDFYGRRNDVLFHWQNTPMPDLLWQLPKTIAGGLVCAATVGRWRKMLEGIGAGFLATVGGVKRQPVPKDIGQAFNLLKQRSQIVRF
jgi:glycosyltransferase involved in cell wall biosynthesis